MVCLNSVHCAITPHSVSWLHTLSLIIQHRVSQPHTHLSHFPTCVCVTTPYTHVSHFPTRVCDRPIHPHVTFPYTYVWQHRPRHCQAKGERRRSQRWHLLLWSIQPPCLLRAHHPPAPELPERRERPKTRRKRPGWVHMGVRMKLQKRQERREALEGRRGLLSKGPQDKSRDVPPVTPGWLHCLVPCWSHLYGCAAGYACMAVWSGPMLVTPVWLCSWLHM